MQKHFKYYAKKIIRAFARILFKGSNYKCNICLRTYRFFLPYGKPLRMNAWCPNCGSLERTRLHWHCFNQIKFPSHHNIKMLHVAPERSLFNKFTKLNIEYHSIDKFEPGYTYPAETIEMDITDLKYAENYFDFILCSHVLEHVPDDFKAMKEMQRVMKNNGFGIIDVPRDMNLETTYEDSTITTPEGRLKAFGQKDHVRLYGMDFESKLVKAGFFQHNTIMLTI